MFDKRTGEIMVNQLIEAGVEHIYGMPGDSINEFMDDLRKQQDKLSFIQVRHEEVGALAASSYAKLTNRLGVCMSIAGPGAIHLLNGLYDAQKDGAPVLAIIGQVSSDAVGTNAFQEVNLQTLFQDVAVFTEQAESSEQLPDLLNMAIRAAYAESGVSVLIVPDDLFAEKHKKQPKLTSGGFVKPQVEPDEMMYTHAVELIQHAKKPIILAGRGVKQAKGELLAFAERMQAPIVFSLLGKGILPDYHPFNLGQHGQIGTKPAYEAMMEADLMIMVGTSFPYRSFLPKDTKAIQIEQDAKKIGNFYPITVGLCGDSKIILQHLTNRIEQKENNFLEKYQTKMKKWHMHIEGEKLKNREPMQAPQVMNALEKFVDDEAIISCDVGNVTVWTVRYFPFTQQDFIISGRLATMGSGLPGAIAGQLAHPDKQVVAICGDGGFGMVMQDFITAVKYDLPVKILVLNNSKIGMIKYEQQQMGHLNYETNLGEMDYAQFANSCGGAGYRIEKIEELEEKMEQAFITSKPAIIDVSIEDKAPLPGKIGYEQAVHYSEFLIKNFFKNKKIEFPDLEETIDRL
ncbi:MAG TPA: pyruvate oxidase [Candidatus Avamphibacillus intestinigallinarum]|nr:pyruvate oxidase [Candidatus Avamphibacillus intestinigallinarum]